MKRLSVLVITHADLVPPDSIDGYSDEEMLDWKSEFDVVATLRDMGHDVRVLGLHDELGALRRTLHEDRPQVVFNLLEEFHGIASYDQHVVSYLELMKQRYTGCNPRGLMIARDKGLSKKILSFHRIPTPRFAIFRRGRAVRVPPRLRYPLFVKSITEDASFGVSRSSLVRDADALAARVRFVHDRIGTDALAEEYIEGRELYVGILGNERLQAFPVWEMSFDGLPEGVPRIATRTLKWNLKYQKKHGIATHAARDLPPEVTARIVRICKRVYRALNLSGFARMDLRLSPEGRVWILEANPNPNLEYGEDFAESASAAGLSYDRLLQRIVNLGLRYNAPWASGA